MANPARALIVGDDLDSDLTRWLRLAGWDCTQVALGAPADELARPTRPDVVVLNLLSDYGRRAPGDFVKFARELRHMPGAIHLPVMMIGDRHAEHTACALDAAANADVDDVMLRPVSEMQILARLSALARIKTMHEELVRRLTTTQRYGIDAPPNVPRPGPVEGVEALVVGASADFADYEQALACHATLTSALTYQTALDYLDRRRFDIVIVDIGDNASGLTEFNDRCRANSRLYNMPIVIVAPRGEVPTTAPLFANGITDLLDKPAAMEELRVRVVALVREVRFRESLRRVYAESRHLATGDALTGLYTRGFALEHLKGLIAAADARSAVFSAAVGRIANIREINSLYGYAVGDRVIRQVGEVIGFVMRGEDLSARYDGACFLTLLPDTRAAAAERALKRVSGVVNHTEFTIPELDVPVPVVFAHASAEFSGHAGPEAFVTALSQRAHP